MVEVLEDAAYIVARDDHNPIVLRVSCGRAKARASESAHGERIDRFETSGRHGAIRRVEEWLRGVASLSWAQST